MEEGSAADAAVGDALKAEAARLASLYDDAQCTFHPEHLLGYAAVAALRLELRYYEAPPPDPVAIPEPVPGFASASGREEAPCDFAAAGYHIRRHSERELSLIHI